MTPYGPYMDGMAKVMFIMLMRISKIYYATK